MQQFKEAQTLCPFKVVPVEELVYQLQKGHFIAYLPEQTMVNIACRDGKASELNLSKGSQQVCILPGCTGTFPHHLVTSDFLVKLNHSIAHYEWQWDPLNFLPANEYHQMEETLKNVGDLRLHQPNLSEPEYLTQLGSIQDTSALGSSTSAWAFNFAGSAFVISCVIIAGCLCFCTCQSRCTYCRSRSHAHHGSQPIIHKWPRSSAEA
jgi:hypothetical protein